ncbi:MAG: DNA translocase FtsK [Candidatus Cryptobacteroides sp.]
MMIKRVFSFRTDMEAWRSAKVVKISGLVVLAFAILALLSSVSYLFTWEADQSLLSAPDRMSQNVDVHNAAGKAGAGLGYLMICRWFGLGSFAFVLALFILAVRMLFGRRTFSVIKAILLSLTAAVISSFIFSFFSRLFNIDTLFGGGLGGQCGSYMIAWSENLFGSILTFCFLLFLLAAWFFFASDKFYDWFIRLGSRKESNEIEADAETGGNNSDDPEDVESFPVNTVNSEELSVDSSVSSSEGLTADVCKGETLDIDKSHNNSEPATEQADSLEIVTGNELSTDVLEDLPRIDVRDELRDYRFPPLELLEDYENSRQEVSQEELKRNNYKIRATLKTYKIDVDNVKAVVGPTVTLYKVYPAPGVKIASIKNLQEDIAMALHAKGVRVVTLSDSVGIEVANDKPSMVPLKAMLNDDSFRESKAELPVAIGYTITQKVKVFDLAEAPHLLVAGATKQGKSVGLNVLISSLLYAKHPSELKFVFIDPKMVEFSAYASLMGHYLAVMPGSSEADEMTNVIAKSAKQAEIMLKALCVEMDARYELLSAAMVNNIKLYNEKYKNRNLRPDHGHKYLPYIVVVIDEYADLTMSVGGSSESKATARSITTSVIRLAQKGRAAGIHVVLATQRPSVDVITGLIKSNFPTRIAFRVFSMTDSRTILDSPGAEKLIGKGDMIYYAGVDMERVQCAFISGSEIHEVTEFIGRQKGYKKSYNTPYYLPEPEPDKTEDGVAMIDMRNLDERFEEAAKQVVMSQKGSTSDLQRKLGMGYAKAGRVMDQLEAAGIVGPQEGSKPRQVLVEDLAELERIIDAYKNGFQE